jgi:hypothetical protein
MKYTTRNVIGAILFTGTLTAATATFAQTVETIETAVTSEGTISELGPQLLVIKSATATEPMRYTSSETTTYVDEEGNPVSVTTVKSGLPVTVYYTKVGDSLVASKVMVRKAVTAPADVPGIKETVTMTAGTISEFGPERITIRTTTSPDPLRYIYSKTTTYVDEAGVPVSIKTVKSGLPVTVHYSKVGDSMIATKVIVRKAVAAPAYATSVGTIGEFGADRITVRTATSPDAVRYSYSKTTTYVDEAGNPVAVTTMKSGQPVTLQYTKVGDTLMVSKVIVRKVVVVPVPPVVVVPAPPVVETKKTTTTTTRTEK